jgi:hypothetical protein
MKGLALFRRTNVPGHWNLASYHSPHSITWSWILSYSLWKRGEAEFTPWFARFGTNSGLIWHVRLPLLGTLRWSRQREMYYRDMWERRRDQDDAEKREHPVRAPMVEGRSPFKPTVIDGGRSIH